MCIYSCLMLLLFMPQEAFSKDGSPLGVISYPQAPCDQAGAWASLFVDAERPEPWLWREVVCVCLLALILPSLSSAWSSWSARSLLTAPHSPPLAGSRHGRSRTWSAEGRMQGRLQPLSIQGAERRGSKPPSPHSSFCTWIRIIPRH